MHPNLKIPTGPCVISFHLSCSANAADVSGTPRPPRRLADYWTISVNLWENLSISQVPPGVAPTTKRLVGLVTRNISPDALSISTLLDMVRVLLSGTDLSGVQVTWDLAALGSIRLSSMSTPARS